MQIRILKFLSIIVSLVYYQLIIFYLLNQILRSINLNSINQNHEYSSNSGIIRNQNSLL